MSKLCPNLKANPHSLTHSLIYQNSLIYQREWVSVCSSSPFCRWSFCKLCRVTPRFFVFLLLSLNLEGLWRNSDGDTTSGVLVLLLELQTEVFQDSESLPWNLTQFAGKQLVFQKNTYSILHKKSVNEVAVVSEPEVRLNPDVPSCVVFTTILQVEEFTLYFCSC